MDAQLWRLTWALPLVIAIGVALIYWLKRMGVGTGVGPAASGSPAEPQLISSTSVSEHTRVLIIEVKHQRFVVFESSVHIAVQPLDATGHLPQPLIFPWRPVRRTS